MSKLFIRTFFLLVAGFLTACSNSDLNKGDLVLMYEATEPGVDSYVARLLVNKDFLRMDDGIDEGGFTLYDRQKKIVYSVSHENQTILKITSGKSSDRMNKTLVLDARKIDDINIPDINGKSPMHYELLVNDKVCASVVAIKGLHQDAVAAIGEFRRALVGIHLKNMANTPDAMQDDCFLAHNILSPSRTLQFGLPVMEEDNNGMRRLLVDYKFDDKITPSVYILPKDYEYINKDG